jgi:tetratricopeptide (TPR) repeat protein
MIYVEELQRRLAEAAEHYRKDPRTIIKLQVHEVIPHGIPFWTPPSLREPLQSWGIVPQAGVLGQALGVVMWNQRAILVAVTVSIEHNDSLQEVPLPTCLSAGSAASLRDAAQVALAHYPHVRSLDISRQLRFRLLDLSGEPLDLPEKIIEGSSLGLAAAVATWSTLAQAPVPPELVFTGALEALLPGGETRVGRVGQVLAKLQGVAAAGARLVFPTANLAEVELAPGSVAVGSVAEAFARAFGPDWTSLPVCQPPPAHDVLADLEWLNLLYKRHPDPARYPELAKRFEDLAGSPALPIARRPLAVSRAVACWTQCDRLSPVGLEQLRNIVERLDPDEVDGADEVTARTRLAMAYRSLYRFEDARIQAEKAWRLGQDLRIHDEKVKARSSLGQILVAMGRVEEGLPHVRAALEHFERYSSPVCSRNHCYHIDALSRLGRFDEVEREYEHALQHCETRVEERARRRQRAFLDYARLNARLRLQRVTPFPHARWELLHEEARRALEGLDSEWPRLGLERIRDAAALRLHSRMEAREAMLSRAVGRYSASQSRLLAWQCGLVFLEAALSELERGGELPRAQGWARAGLRAVPFRRAWKFLGAGRALRAGSPSDLKKALLFIVEAEQY